MQINTKLLPRKHATKIPEPPIKKWHVTFEKPLEYIPKVQLRSQRMKTKKDPPCDGNLGRPSWKIWEPTRESLHLLPNRICLCAMADDHCVWFTLFQMGFFNCNSLSLDVSGDVKCIS